MKKLFLMLMATVFITAAYAQETKEQKAKRLLNMKDKKAVVIGPRTTTTTVQETKEQKAKRILNMKDKKPVAIPTKKAVVTPGRDENSALNKKMKKRKHHKHHKHPKHPKHPNHPDNHNGKHDEGNRKHGDK